MKVEQEKKFEPITIILETKDEATILWHRLNVAQGKTIIEYYEEDWRNRSPELLRLENTNLDSMWSALDKVFRP